MFVKVHERFIRLMSGVEHLTDKLSEVKIDTPPIPLSEDTVVDVLAQCEQKLKMLMKGQNAADQDDAPVVRPQSVVRENNVRVKIEEHDLGDDLPMDNEDDGVDDEVMDRDDVKRNSSTVVDKATKRSKRGKAKGSRSGG